MYNTIIRNRSEDIGPNWITNNNKLRNHKIINDKNSYVNERITITSVNIVTLSVIYAPNENVRKEERGVIWVILQK